MALCTLPVSDPLIYGRYVIYGMNIMSVYGQRNLLLYNESPSNIILCFKNT